MQPDDLLHRLDNFDSIEKTVRLPATQNALNTICVTPNGLLLQTDFVRVNTVEFVATKRRS